MNPLFLLMGLVGAGAHLFASRSSSDAGDTRFGIVDTSHDAPESPEVPGATDTPPVSAPPVVEEPEAPSEPEEPQEPETPSEPEEPQEPPVAEEPQPEEPQEPQEPPVAEEPQPEDPSETEEPSEPESPANPNPEPPTQDGGTGESGGQVPTYDSTGTVSVISGRVATLDSVADAVEVRIVDNVNEGNVSVNPDGTLAVVMTQSDFVGQQTFTYEAVYADGSTSLNQVSLDITPPVQEGGWGTGESQYMLATDENDKVIVETGENSQTVYVSGAPNALSLADIAAMEGLSTSQITGQWLANSDYGRSESLALDDEAGMQLWNTITFRGSYTSNQLLLERGYQYELGRILDRDTNGESEMNPILVGAYGDGDRPDITTYFQQFQESSSNVVFQDLNFSGGVLILGGENIIFDNVEAGDKISVQQSSGITIRNSEFLDIVREASLNGGDWEQHLDRLSGFYSDATDGLLLEGNLFDKIAWADDYDPLLSGSGGQPPSMYSQNIYINARMTDVTMRDTITMRAASFGAQIRSGAFVEDNVFLDNNAAFYTAGGDYNGAGPVGNYTLMSDNLVTSAGSKDAIQIGARAMGIWDVAQMTSYVDNIVANLADPNNPDELAWKTSTQNALDNLYAFYDDTIVYNWEGSETVWADWFTLEQNIEGLNTSVLDQTTIQIFTAQLLGQETATITDLADYLRAQADGAFDDVVDADLIIRFFQEGYGIAPDIRGGAETLRFIPNDLGDGVRWDNRLNWDTDDLPGLYETDSADLGGNDVVFGTNATIDTLDFGPDGSLNVYGGRLTLNGGVTGEDGGALNVEGAGQFWTEGSDAADFDIAVESGRFANTGLMQNADLTATGGQAILATGGAEFDLGASKTLSVFAAAARVGFDGDDGGMAILDMQEGSTLAFEAQDGGLGTIEEFRSGAFDNATDVLSGIDLGNAVLDIDLSGLSASAGTSFTLMDADEIVGLFDEAVVGGLGARNATIVVDYEADSVTLQLSAGNGAVSIQTVGNESDTTSDEQALWNALTADQGVVSDSAAGQVAEEDDMLDTAA